MTDEAMSQTPPILQVPSDKERRYDRQLRLWAASGQAALESANILLVNSGSGTVGIETLKNLVLPGIAAFTIYDPALVQEPDLGVNFFVDEEHLGKSRSQTCTEMLLELNSEVQGEWHPKSENPVDLEGLLATSPTFTIILYSNPISIEDLATLEKYGEAHKSPIFSIHSAGFYSYFQVNLHGPFPIVDTHPDQTATTDLRLLSPWPELLDFARKETADIGNLDNHEHGHLPYVVILLHYLDEWRKTHDGSHPSNYKEKIAFRQLVSDGTRRDNPEGGEENFEEAVGAVLRNIEKPSLPSGLREVFDYQDNIPTQGRTGFWLIAEAIKQFYDKHQCLPVPGSVPDMKAKSQVYVQLQTLYKNKARKDAEEVLAIAQNVAGGACEVDPAEVDLFCKNAAFVKLINAAGPTADRLQKVAEEQFASDENAEAFMMPHSLMPIYLALHATSHGAPTTPLTEEEIWTNITKAVPAAAGNGRVQAAVKEVARARGGELHNISALTGGMVAQEMIKIITRQYVPIDNTCVFDGLASRTQVLRL